MNLQVAKRLKKWMNEKSLNATELANVLGVQKSSISHILSGRNKPSFDFLSKLKTQFPDINLDWIVSGNENVYSSNQESIENKENINQNKDTDKNIVEVDALQSSQDKNITKNKQIISNQVDSIMVVYKDNTFKILKERD